jgi:hypothetical protein
VESIGQRRLDGFAAGRAHFDEVIADSPHAVSVVGSALLLGVACEKGL